MLLNFYVIMLPIY